MDKTLKTSNLPSIAVFDFDNTLTRQDSLIPFLRIVSGLLQFWWGLFVMSPVLAGYALKLIPNWRAKELIITHFLSGSREKQLNQYAVNFALEEIPKMLRSEAVQRLQWHQAQGHQTVLVSASLEAYLLPWAMTMGFDRVIGTKLESKSGILTGRIQNKNCYGKEKVERLKSVLGDLSKYHIYAYGDSRGDKELLNIANVAYYRKFHDTNHEVEPSKDKPHFAV